MKKVFSVFLALVLCFTLFGVIGATAVEPLTLTASSVEGKAGDTVTVEISVANNTGFGTLAYELSFDNTKLELTANPTDEIAAAGAIPSDYTNVKVETGFERANQIGVYVDGWQPAVLSPGTYSTPITYNGVVNKYQFKIKDDVAAGTEIALDLKIVTCSMDDENYTKVDNAVVNGQVKVACTEHTWGEWTNVTPATCTTAGSEKRVCSVCGSEETREIPAIGHDWGEWVDTDPATCTEAGSRERVCKNDPSHKETQTIPALGHDWGEWEVTAPTADAEGSRTRVCSRDASHVQTEVLATLNTVFENDDKTLKVEAGNDTTYLPKDMKVDVVNNAEEVLDEETLKAFEDAVTAEYEGMSLAGISGIGMTLGEGEDEYLIDLNGGVVKVTTAMRTFENFEDDITIVAFDAEGNLKELDYTVEDGNIVFESSDSFVGLAYIGTAIEEEPNNPTTPTDPTTPGDGDNAGGDDTDPQMGDSMAIFVAVIVMLIAAAGVIIAKKRIKA